MSQQINPIRLTIAIGAVLLCFYGFISASVAGQKRMDAEDKGDLTLLEKAQHGTFGFAYKRNTTSEAVANTVLATKQEFVAMTAYVIMANPSIDPEEAARQALIEILRRNRTGEALPQE